MIPNEQYITIKPLSLSALGFSSSLLISTTSAGSSLISTSSSDSPAADSDASGASMAEYQRY